MSKTLLCHLSQQALSILQAANETDSTLLITGSTGTGKSHLAQFAHQTNKKRALLKWAKVNLATLSETLIESELFGHERGAFTGADLRRVGRLEICEGGTIFLDEIGELTPRLQAKLLDFIQYKKISPVGSNREIILNVRIIAATNRNLDEAVKAGQFRADLYHRLNVFHICIPEFSENKAAILEFAKDFLKNKNKCFGKNILGFSLEFENVLQLYPWPGNVRELENIILFSAAMEKTQFLQISSAPDYFQKWVEKELKITTLPQQSPTEHESHQKKPETPPLDLDISLVHNFHQSKDAFERAYLTKAMQTYHGQINLTSRQIGLNKVSLAEKLRKYGIDWKKIRKEDIEDKQNGTDINLSLSKA